MQNMNGQTTPVKTAITAGGATVKLQKLFLSLPVEGEIGCLQLTSLMCSYRVLR